MLIKRPNYDEHGITPRAQFFNQPLEGAPLERCIKIHPFKAHKVLPFG
jgi:hypothetical protein